MTARGLREPAGTIASGRVTPWQKETGSREMPEPGRITIRACARRTVDVLLVAAVSRGISVGAGVGRVTDFGPVDENVRLLDIDITLTGARQVE